MAFITLEQRDLCRAMAVGFVRYRFVSMMENHTNASLEDVLELVDVLTRKSHIIVDYSDIVEIAKEFYPHFADRIDKLMVLI